MKKIYLGLSAAIIATSSFAQGGSVIEEKTSAVHVKQNVTIKHNSHISDVTRSSAIWANDFSTPADWSIGNNSGNTDDWVIGTGIPSGSFAIAGITSTTAANNFALFDSDLLCSGSQDGWIGNATPINLASVGAVAIQFESYYRKFQGTCWVDVSPDGSTWTPYEIHGTLAANDAVSTNPTVVTVNVSAQLANAGTAYFRFRYNGGCDYAWMVDDVCITQPPANEMELLASSFFETTGGIPYTLAPDEQGPSIVNQFNGTYTNTGVNTQTATQIIADIYDGTWGTLSNLTGNPTTTAGGQTVSDSAGTWTVGSTIDDYYALVGLDYANIAMDSFTNNNTDTFLIQVTDYEYGRDHQDFAYNGGGLWNGAGNSYQLANEYDMFVDQNLSHVKVAFSGNTAPGVIMFPVVYQVDQTTGDFNPIYDGSSVGSGEYTVQAGDLSSGSATWVEIPLDVPGGFITLTAGEQYLVGVGHYGGASDLVILNGGLTAPDQTVFILDGTDNTWYFLTSTASVRAIFHPSASVADLEGSNLMLGQNVPNPANGVTTINYTLNESANVTFEVTDLTGKVLKSVNYGKVGAGEHTINLDATEFAKGVYFYSMTSGTERLSKRMVITK